ncbi:MAG TPA: outer membrane beta-barrel protein [Candidatus Acidoferrum sp.]|nr:outer membrane beta-barrel protein [Candidatus Acidoferrum sp.]
MPCRKTLLVALLLTLFAVPGAFAQGFGQGFGQHEFEITPFGGYKFGGKIDIPPDTNSAYDYLPIESSPDYGIDADYSIWPNFQAEFQFNHQPTDIDAHEFATGTSVLLTSSDINMYQFGFAYNLKSPDAKLKPFFGAGLGFTQWRPSAALPFSHTFSYNLGGGVKYFFSSHVGVRLDVRYSPSRTTTQNEEFCDPFYGFCGTEPVSSHAEQGQVNVGLIFRFHSSYGS